MLKHNKKSTDIYVDLGTANTLVYRRGQGFLVNAPSCLTVSSSSFAKNPVVAIGQNAKVMIGREHSGIQVIRPLKEGVIADIEKTRIMLDGFFKDKNLKQSWFRPRMVISLPCRVSKQEKDAVREVGFSLGARQVYLLDEPVAAAVGANLPILGSKGSMIVDIGGGTTEIAVISCGGIIHSNAVRVGGDTMDADIIEYIKNKYNFLIGEQTAEKLKISLGCAKPPEIIQTLGVGGNDLRSGWPRTLNISNEDIFRALNPTISRIVESIKVALSDAPPEVAGDLIDFGLVLAGGGSLVKQMDLRIFESSGVRARYSQKPLHSIAVGGAIILENDSLLEKIAI